MEPNIFIFVQARSDSTRLPGKSLKEVIPGVCLASLCAKRAQNTGRPVLVLTSNESSDDLLAEKLTRDKINVFRGSLQNVLKRFYDGLLYQNAKADDWVVRLTGDNPVPDGVLIDEMLSSLKQSPCRYFACSHPYSRLPYGVSVEIFKASTLFTAYENASDCYDLEHVTPWIKRNYLPGYFLSPLGNDLSHLRCTVDHLDDFEHIKWVFSKAENIFLQPYRDFLPFLNQREPSSDSKIILGCAQLGMKYGINNKKGMLETKEQNELLNYALRVRIHHFDSAMDYGRSEEVIGNFFYNQNINPVFITKLNPNCLNITGKRELKAELDNLLQLSLKRLKRKKLDVLLFHRKEQISYSEQEIYKWAQAQKNNGLIKELGCSLTCPSELEEVISHKDLTYLQIPINLFDHRWNFSLMEKIKFENKLNIVARSIYLQGLIFLPYQDWPEKLKHYGPQVQNILQQLVKEYKVESLAELGFRYVNSISWIDKIVVGCEEISQIDKNVHYLQLPSLRQEQVMEIHQKFVFLGDDFLNPARWYL